MKAKLIVALALFVGVVIIVYFVLARLKATAPAEAEERQRSAQDGTGSQEALVRLDLVMQEKAGLVLTVLTPVTNQFQVRSFGLVLSPSDLADLRQRCVAAEAHVETAQTASKVAEEEYQRTKLLFDKGETASQKAYQAAAGARREAQAAARAAGQELETARENARQRWGAVIAAWVVDGTPEFQRLVRQQDLLVQLTVPAGTKPFPAPSEAAIQAADGQLLSARFVAAAPVTDSRLQGQSFYYLVPSPGTALLPAMNVVAFLPIGKPIGGVVVPYSAVVWLRGLAWAYVRQGATNFARQRISTEQPHPEGWFQPNTALANQSVVVQGGQVLLSVALGTQTKLGGEDED